MLSRKTSVIKNLQIIAVVGSLFFCAAGCGDKKVTIEGTVTLDGASIEGAMVTFTPIDPSPQAAVSGITDDKGSFKTHPPTKPGTYKVTVSKSPKLEGVVVDPNNPMAAMGKAMEMEKIRKQYKSGIDEKYSDLKKTPIPDVTVPPGNVGEIKVTK